MSRHAWWLPFILFLAACTPAEQPFVPPVSAPQIDADAFLPGDGASLPLRQWKAKKKVRAVIIALHGMNDYSHAFEDSAKYFATQGITTYAYDQRGFGGTPHKGIWAGDENLTSDLRQMVSAVKERHTGVPVYVLGESMGGAVALIALSAPDAPCVAGVILSAPAVWGGENFNPFLRATLWTGAHLFPTYTFTGEDANVQASDNIPMLRALGRDPLVLKNARIDTIYGMVHLMDHAHNAAPKFAPRSLLLYGAHDQVIPAGALADVAEALPAPKLVAVYPQGWHMLLRDLQAERVRKDIAAWVLKREPALPSGFAHEHPEDAFRAGFPDAF